MKKKKSGFNPTKKSMEISKSIADKLNLDFKKKEVEYLAQNLHKVYYDEIINKLNLDLDKTEFEHGSVRKINAVVKTTGDIYFDEQLDFWLFDMCFINSLASFEEIEISILSEILSTTLDIFKTPRLFEFKRGRLLPLKNKYLDVLKFSHSLSKAMIVFIICHEIAHIKSNHLTNSKLSTHAKEYEADALGFEYFKKVILYPEKTGYIALQSFMLCAPIIFFNYLALEELYSYKTRGTKHSRETHPSPLERSEKLTTLLLEATSDEHDSEVLRILLGGIDNLIKLLP